MNVLLERAQTNCAIKTEINKITTVRILKKFWNRLCGLTSVVVVTPGKMEDDKTLMFRFYKHTHQILQGMGVSYRHLHQ